MEKGFLQAAAENLQFVAVCVLVIAVLIGAAALIEKKFLAQNIASVRRTRYLTLSAMLGALAMILHLFDFPVVFLAPGFQTSLCISKSSDQDFKKLQRSDLMRFVWFANDSRYCDGRFISILSL